MRSPVLVVALFAAGSPAYAQEGMVGPQRFPNLRNLGGLPGNGVPIGRDGEADDRGALTYSTPVAYALGHGRWVGAASVLNYENTLELRLEADRDVLGRGNGTATLQTGLGLGVYGSLAAGVMVLSGSLDTAFNFQWQPGRQRGRFRVAVGVQDLRGNAGSAGDVFVPEDARTAFSPYAVGTAELAPGAHASLGVGIRRWRGLWGNGCADLAPRLKGTVEYDAFNWNWGLGYDLGRLRGGSRSSPSGREARAYLMLGSVRGKYPYWSVAFSF